MKNILVLGMYGFLGKALTKELRRQGHNVLHYNRYQIQLLSPISINKFLLNHQIDTIYHLAGKVGGIQTNLELPASMFYENTMMALNVLEGYKNHKDQIGKLVSVVASCAYPEEELITYESHESQFEPREIMEEKDYFDGTPHDSVACHGYAKRNLQLASKYYSEQHGLNAVCVCPTTIYGPGQDYSVDNSKVMAAAIRKIVDAKERNAQPIFWGSGKPLREFIYVDDVAKLMIKAAEVYNNHEIPLNLGSDQELSIKDLAKKISNMIGYSGVIKWDTAKPDGAYRKLLDLKRMKKYLGEFEFTPLDIGIKNCIEDYKNRYLQ